MLNIGTPAPDFTVDSTQGTIHLKDYIRKKNVILYFSEKDSSESSLTVNSIQYMREIQGALEEFKRMDTVFLGISQDHLKDLQKLADREGYNFSLIADSNFSIGDMYEISLDENSNIVSTVCLIDMDGVVYYGKEGYPEIRELLNQSEQAS